MRTFILLFLFAASGLSSSTPASRIPQKLEQTINFLQSLYEPKNFALTSTLDSVFPILRGTNQVLRGLSEPFTWSQLIQLQGTTSMALMYLRGIRPLIQMNDQQRALDVLVADWRTHRYQIKQMVHEKPGTVNDLSSELVNEIHAALVELKDVHSRLTELLSKPVEGLNEFIHRNAYRLFDTSSELFEDWSLRPIALCTVTELRDLFRLASGEAESLAKFADLYHLPATISVGRELKRIVIRIRLFLTNIQPPHPETDVKTMALPPRNERARDLASSISGSLGHTIMIISAVETRNEGELLLTQDVLSKLHIEKRNVQRSSPPTVLFESCSTVVALVRLYARSRSGQRVAWMKISVPAWEQLRRRAADLLNQENTTSDIPEGVRDEFRVVMSDIHRFVSELVASGRDFGKSSRGFLIIAEVMVDDLSTQSLMKARTAVFAQSLKGVVGMLDDVLETLSGALGQELKQLIARLRPISRHARLTLKRLAAREITAVTTESISLKEIESESSSIEDAVEVAEVQAVTTEAPATRFINTNTESEGDWLKTRHEVRRDMKKLKDQSHSSRSRCASEGRQRLCASVTKRNDTTTDKHIPITEQRVESLRRLLKPKTTEPTPATHRPTPSSSTNTLERTGDSSASTGTESHETTPRSVDFSSVKMAENPLNTQETVGSSSVKITEANLKTRERAASSSTQTTQSRPITYEGEASTTTEATDLSPTTYKAVSLTTEISETVTQSVSTNSVVPSSIMAASNELNLRNDAMLEKSFEGVNYGNQEYVLQHLVVPQPVTQIGTQIPMLADTMGNIVQEINVLAVDASGSSRDEATSFNIGLLCQQLTSTRTAIEQLRLVATGFEDFTNQLPPVIYPVICTPYTPQVEET